MPRLPEAACGGHPADAAAGDQNLQAHRETVSLPAFRQVIAACGIELHFMPGLIGLQCKRFR
jgi:hypothetical protein